MRVWRIFLSLMCEARNFIFSLYSATFHSFVYMAVLNKFVQTLYQEDLILSMDVEIVQIVEDVEIVFLRDCFLQDFWDIAYECVYIIHS